MQNRFLKKVMRYVYGCTITIINCVIPKNCNYMIFHSGQQYSDNSRAIYEKMIKMNFDKDFQYFWIVDSINIFKDSGLFGTNTNFIKSNTFKSLWYFCRSKYIFSTHGLWLNKYISGRQIFINLWHGMPIKRIGLCEQGVKKYPLGKYDFMPVTSNLFKLAVSKCFGSDLDKNCIIGMPRNDFLFEGRDVLEKMGIDKEFNKVIIWMPTFRGSSHRKTEGVESELGLPVIEYRDLDKINEVLVTRKMLLLIKLHPYQSKNLDTSCFDNIIVFSDQDIPITHTLYNILGIADCLITDYSSVMVDYLILDRPMAFVYDDLYQYEKTRGFVFDKIEELLPGKQISKIGDFLGFLEDLGNDKDDYSEIRNRISAQFNYYNDGDNSRRLIEEIQKLYFKN